MLDFNVLLKWVKVNKGMLGENLKNTEKISLDNFFYLFVDPIGRWDSGISSYIHNASAILTLHNIKNSIFTKEKHESLEQFRTRLAEYVKSIKNPDQKIFVEAPETKASTALVSLEDAYIHIRLHCSLNLGALAEGREIYWPIFFMERAEIERADRVSSPSMSSVIATRQLFELERDISCYPNPVPTWIADKSTPMPDSPFNILFVGRWQALKGVHFLIELAKKLPWATFTVVTILNEKVPRSLPKNITLVDGSSWNKEEVYKKANVIIIPSVYETASMVGLEALSLGIPVIAWSHLGIAEYADTPIIHRVSPGDMEAFCNALIVRRDEGSIEIKDASLSSTINDLFLLGVQRLIRGEIKNYMPVTLGEKEEMVIKSLVKGTDYMGIKVKVTSYSKIRSKFRKLRNNPRLFFRDSWLVKALVKKGMFSKHS